MTEKKKAIIIGGGPAGLTAAYELATRTDIQPIIYEQDAHIGGIARTIKYKGNRIDLGGHRFFSKEDRVMNWWLNLFPMQGAPAWDYKELGRAVSVSEEPNAPDPDKSDVVMLVRNRLSRIYFLGKFFNYPLSLNLGTILNLGFFRMFVIGFSYIRASLFPIKPEKNLEDFFINRFGRELYLTFFKDYTEKVWGVACTDIQPEWGAQRIKGLSITRALWHMVTSIFAGKKDVRQKETETSLIEQFFYPKFGPGQMWEEAARIIEEKGGEVHLETKIVSLKTENNKISGIEIMDKNGNKSIVKGDYIFSTMPMKELISGIEADVPHEVRTVSEGLLYRDFLTVGLLCDKLKLKNETTIKTINNVVPDNWIYIQEASVTVGRLQVFNNWSPYLVKDKNTVWVGMEYFCDEKDELWNMADDDVKKLAIGELAKINVIETGAVLDTVVHRMPKAYPGYFGTYNKLSLVREFLDPFENLYLIGRNGMHRYNNMDHSMLTAMVAVDNIIEGRLNKDNIWNVNTEEDYHEEK